MEDAITPFGPLAERNAAPADRKQEESALAEVVVKLEECRKALDDLDQPLAAAHVDMAVHVLADSGAV